MMQDLTAQIRRLARERNAIILAHNYQVPEVQDVADICGDSLELSMQASRTDADVIVFCGVRFMAETASILCPDKTVLLPAGEAGCSMADMISAEDVKARKAASPSMFVLSYVNTTAEVKAESDICCTSANAVAVARSVDERWRIFMTPDRNLARYTIRETGRDMDYWDGYCIVHDRLSSERVRKVKADHPGALFVAHPECRPEVLELADAVKSTSGMLAFARETDCREFIIGTETGLLHPLRKANPDKLFTPADPGMICKDMKKTGLHEILNSLETLAPEVKVPEEIRLRAKNAVDCMLAVSKD
ncbi:MAG: quinolinate synthase NadA [Desulfobacteraceae bacterium]